jgi:tetratricopeptide (TPR) repeat protein
MGRRPTSRRPTAEYDAWAEKKGRGAFSAKLAEGRSGKKRPSLFPSRWVAVAVCGLLLAGAALVYCQTAGFRLNNYDDDKYIVGPVLGGLTVETARWAFTKCHEGNWTPLTWLSHMLDSELYGNWSGGRHLTSILLHAASVVVLFLALWQMTGRLWLSALATALWALHPLRVESVAWVAERKDVLAGFFFVLALWAYAGYARRPFSTLRYLAVIGLFALGLMAKPIVNGLPVLLLLLDYWPLGRLRWARSGGKGTTRGGEEEKGRGGDLAAQRDSRVSPFPPLPLSRLLLEKLPLLALAAASSVVTVRAQVGTIAPEEQLGFLWRLGSVPISYVFYLVRFFYPVDLAAFYPRPSALPAWMICSSTLVLLGITAAAVWSWRRRPYLLVGWLWFLGMLLPAIGLVQFGVQTVADRFTYLPQIGLVVALVWWAASIGERGEAKEELAGRGRQPSVVAAIAEKGEARGERGRQGGGRVLVGSSVLLCSLVLAVLAVLSWRQTSFWYDSRTLWTHDLQCVDDNALGENDLGLSFYERGRSDEAIVHYAKAVKLDPNYFMALNNFGAALADLRRFDEAIVRYQQALRLQPNDMGTHCNMAAALIAAKRFDEAAEQCRLALRAEPRCGKAHFDLGRINNLQQRPGEAVKHFDLAIQLAEHDPAPHFSPIEAHYAAAVILVNQGRPGDAIGHYAAMLRINPNLVDVRNDMGVALASDGRLEEAIEQYRAALAVKPDFAIARKNLELALGHRRDLASRIAGLRDALRADPGRVDLMTSLAWWLAVSPAASLRNGSEALDLAERANRLCGGKHFGPLQSLAAAYAEVGRFPEAVDAARRALALADAQAPPVVAGQIHAQIARYQAGKPCRVIPPPLNQ